MKHHETLAIRCDDIGARCGDICVWGSNVGDTWWSFNATISGLDAETSGLGDVGDRRRVSGDIGDCGVGITPQMCNRVTNH